MLLMLLIVADAFTAAQEKVQTCRLRPEVQEDCIIQGNPCSFMKLTLESEPQRQSSPLAPARLKGREPGRDKFFDGTSQTTHTGSSNPRACSASLVSIPGL